MKLSKRLADSWLSFMAGALTAALAFTIADWGRSPAAGQVGEELPTKPAAFDAAPQASTRLPAPLPSPATPGAPAAPAASAGQNLVLVTATPQVFSMQPVPVTPTAVLSEAEQQARARAADEAMRQSTEGMQAEMP
jgi:hypothetical protein